MEEIKIDIDNAKIDWQRIKAVIEFFGKTCGYKECMLKFATGTVMSRNPTHHHIIIEAENISESHIPFLQLMLGSDWRREMLNFARLYSMRPFKEQNILFEENYKPNWKATAKLRRIIGEANGHLI